MVMLSAGCATSYNVDVDAMSNPQALQTGYSFRIETLDPSKSINDARFPEVASLVRTALSGRGMYEAPAGETAEVIIDIDYGVGPMQTRLVRSHVDHFGSQQIDPITGMPRGHRDPRTGAVIGVPTPSMGTNNYGYREEMVAEKYLTIIARDARVDASGNANRVELWRVHVTVEDDGDDISEYLPVLAAAATDYIGSDTQEKQRLRVSENDEVVDFVKQGL